MRCFFCKDRFNKNDWLALLFFILIVEAAGIIGSLFTTPSIPTWYASLAKPAFNPPSWVFAPVWTLLFLLMGVAVFLVWRKGINNRQARVALYVFAGQLVLNILWSVLFFGLHSPLAAFCEVVVLWLAICWTIISFNRVSKAAAWLLMPYIFWVSFATLLNFSLMILNR